MKNPTYLYSLLQYRHSQLLGEVLNIGMMVYFIDNNRLVFIKPDNLARLRYAYSNVSEDTIKMYFRAFDERIERLNTSGQTLFPFDIDGAFRQFIATEFLPEDASALQFAEIKKAVQFVDNQDAVCRQLYATYFSVFDNNLLAATG